MTIWFVQKMTLKNRQKAAKIKGLAAFVFLKNTIVYAKKKVHFAYTFLIRVYRQRKNPLI